MKTLITLMIGTVLLISSCKKDNVQPLPAPVKCNDTTTVIDTVTFILIVDSIDVKL